MERGEPVKLGLWAQAQGMALQTPVTRNRYVDFLRALSILAVISGHWFMAAPHVVKGNLTVSNMLEIEPWTRWFTWGFQVMPIFFLVGGYARSFVECGYQGWPGLQLLVDESLGSPH